MTESSDTRQETLPEFRYPPIGEVVLACYFEEITNLSGPMVGKLWTEKFPELKKVQEVNPVADQVEQFGDAIRAPMISLSLDNTPRSRTWLVSEDDQTVVQIQRSYFAQNWRNHHDRSIDYPRYDSVKNKFKDSFVKFGEFVEENELGTLSPFQCEVAYINYIDTSSGVWNTLGDADKIFTVLNKPFVNTVMPYKFENVNWNSSAVIELDGVACGRLHIRIEPRNSSKGEPIYRFSLTARGAPIGSKGSDLEKMFDFFDLGHKWIVRSFAELTTKEMQDVWERTDDGTQ